VALYAYDDAVKNLALELKMIAPGEASDTHLTLLEELGDVWRLLRDGGAPSRSFRRPWKSAVV
jgi:hypothetical protein